MSGPGGDRPAVDPGRIRIDKWLFFARFFKTRALAAAMVSAGRLRLDGRRIAKPGHSVGPGDVLTFPQGARIRVVRVLSTGARRGPAAEAQELYQDLSLPTESDRPDDLDESADSTPDDGTAAGDAGPPRTAPGEPLS